MTTTNHISVFMKFRKPITLLGLAVCVQMTAACTQRAPDLVQMPAMKPAAVLIQNVGVLDVQSGTITADQDVLLTANRIVSIGPTGKLHSPPESQKISGRGATLLPGLIDMHGHTGNAPEPSWLNRLPDPDRNLRS